MDPRTRNPLYLCKRFYPGCMPCPYRVGRRAADCPHLQEMYNELRDYSIKLAAAFEPQIQAAIAANHEEASDD